MQIGFGATSPLGYGFPGSGGYAGGGTMGAPASYLASPASLVYPPQTSAYSPRSPGDALQVSIVKERFMIVNKTRFNVFFYIVEFFYSFAEKANYIVQICQFFRVRILTSHELRRTVARRRYRICPGSQEKNTRIILDRLIWGLYIPTYPRRYTTELL